MEQRPAASARLFVQLVIQLAEKCWATGSAFTSCPPVPLLMQCANFHFPRQCIISLHKQLWTLLESLTIHPETTHDRFFMKWHKQADKQTGTSTKNKDTKRSFATIIETKVNVISIAEILIKNLKKRLLRNLFKAIFHFSRIIHSICPHLYADVRMGEDLQFTKQSWSFSRKQPCS